MHIYIITINADDNFNKTNTTAKTPSYKYAIIYISAKLQFSYRNYRIKNSHKTLNSKWIFQKNINKQKKKINHKISDTNIHSIVHKQIIIVQPSGKCNKKCLHICNIKQQRSNSKTKCKERKRLTSGKAKWKWTRKLNESWTKKEIACRIYYIYSVSNKKHINKWQQD